jgi:hypothetical protein
MAAPSKLHCTALLRPSFAAGPLPPRSRPGSPPPPRAPAAPRGGFGGQTSRMRRLRGWRRRRSRPRALQKPPAPAQPGRAKLRNQFAPLQPSPDPSTTYTGTSPLPPSPTPPPSSFRPSSRPRASRGSRASWPCTATFGASAPRSPNVSKGRARPCAAVRAPCCCNPGLPQPRPWPPGPGRYRSVDPQRPAAARRGPRSSRPPGHRALLCAWHVLAPAPRPHARNSSPRASRHADAAPLPRRQSRDTCQSGPLQRPER